MLYCVRTALRLGQWWVVAVIMMAWCKYNASTSTVIGDAPLDGARWLGAVCWRHLLAVLLPPPLSRFLVLALALARMLTLFAPVRPCLPLFAVGPAQALERQTDGEGQGEAWCLGNMRHTRI
jgi:hypothetical protein